MENSNDVTRKDITHSSIKGILGTIPVLGALASEIFSLVITPPLEKRRVEWMNNLAAKLDELEKNSKIDFNELKENNLFIDVVLQATERALKTSEEEKIEAFQNAVLNTAITDSSNNTKSQIFLNLLDKFTSWHLKVLKFIDNPSKWFSDNGIKKSYGMGSISVAIKDAFPELQYEDELLDIIWLDLRNANFHKTEGINSTISGHGMLANRTTAIGREFLEFIEKYKK